MADGRYDGPVCYVSPDTTCEVPDTGRRLFGRFRKPKIRVLEGGWHYSVETVDTRDGPRDLPGRRLHLNDTNPDELFYEYADDSHRSWHEKHPGRIVQLQGLPEGEEHPPEAHSDHPGHALYHAERGSAPGRIGRAG